jgi:hypothetical protein
MSDFPNQNLFIFELGRSPFIPQGFPNKVWFYGNAIIAEFRTDLNDDPFQPHRIIYYLGCDECSESLLLTAQLLEKRHRAISFTHTRDALHNRRLVINPNDPSTNWEFFYDEDIITGDMLFVGNEECSPILSNGRKGTAQFTLPDYQCYTVPPQGLSTTFTVLQFQAMLEDWVIEADQVFGSPLDFILNDDDFTGCEGFCANREAGYWVRLTFDVIFFPELPTGWFKVSDPLGIPFEESLVVVPTTIVNVLIQFILDLIDGNPIPRPIWRYLLQLVLLEFNPVDDPTQIYDVTAEIVFCPGEPDPPNPPANLPPNVVPVLPPPGVVTGPTIEVSLPEVTGCTPGNVTTSDVPVQAGIIRTFDNGCAVSEYLIPNDAIPVNCSTPTSPDYARLSLPDGNCFDLPYALFNAGDLYPPPPQPEVWYYRTCGQVLKEFTSFRGFKTPFVTDDVCNLVGWRVGTANFADPVDVLTTPDQRSGQTTSPESIYLGFKASQTVYNFNPNGSNCTYQDDRLDLYLYGHNGTGFNGPTIDFVYERRSSTDLPYPYMNYEALTLKEQNVEIIWSKDGPPQCGDDSQLCTYELTVAILSQDLGIPPATPSYSFESYSYIGSCNLQEPLTLFGNGQALIDTGSSYLGDGDFSGIIVINADQGTRILANILVRWVRNGEVLVDIPVYNIPEP